MKNNSLEREIKDILNKTSRENISDTPDFILAEYLIDCLEAFEKATNKRNQWYTTDNKPACISIT
ncbi:hypothetical protein CMI47_13310 [Candidatus Pacearchaeota archaeon]|nr:hypothetical protein [Candidatus Pacearchaeota archaeon]